MAKETRWRPEDESDELIFAVCERFLRGEKAARIAAWVQRECNRPDFRRTQIYPLLGAAIRKGFFQLFPPVELDMSKQIRQVYKLPHQDPDAVRVVNVRDQQTHVHLATAAASLVVRLIERVREQKRAAKYPEPVAVHLGLGGGLTTMMVARSLAGALAAERDLPKLVIHTLSSGGFLPTEPLKSPISYFSYFEGLPIEIEYLALFTETVVSIAEFTRVCSNPAVKWVMDQAKEIDIVVTSLAAAADEHGLLRQYLKWLVDSGGLSPDRVQAMEAAGWVGDVQFRPYSATGPIPDVCGVRAVTVLEIPQLVEWANSTIFHSAGGGAGGRSVGPQKYVVLVAGPCAQCGALKTEALRPILTEEKLRVFTHLVTDWRTAEQLLATAATGSRGATGVSAPPSCSTGPAAAAASP